MISFLFCPSPAAKFSLPPFSLYQICVSVSVSDISLSAMRLVKGTVTHLVRSGLSGACLGTKQVQILTFAERFQNVRRTNRKFCEVPEPYLGLNPSCMCVF